MKLQGCCVGRIGVRNIRTFILSTRNPCRFLLRAGRYSPEPLLKKMVVYGEAVLAACHSNINRVHESMSSDAGTQVRRRLVNVL